MNNIYYLCCSALTNLDVLSRKSEIPMIADAIIHFYIKTIDSTNAGAIAADLCNTFGFSFVEFIYLPQIETFETLHPLQEHEIAFQKAQETGIAVLISKVLDGEHNLVDFSRDGA
jgi:hypothetical protein